MVRTPSKLESLSRECSTSSRPTLMAQRVALEAPGPLCCSSIVVPSSARKSSEQPANPAQARSRSTSSSSPHSVLCLA
eukprot:scaffold4498_cov119-Isochrysis_galbana.AAC.43